jgi:PAS domain-containing protein
VNHFALGTAVLALGLLGIPIPFWRRARRRSGAGGVPGAYEAAFTQSPHGTLVVDASSLAIVDANFAMQRSLGYALEELREMSLGQIFSDEGGPPEALLAKLRESPVTLLIETGQRCHSGRFLYVR